MTPSDRRQFLHQLSGTFASIALAGCGGGKDAPTPTAVAAAPAPVVPPVVPAPPGPVSAPAPIPVAVPAPPAPAPVSPSNSPPVVVLAGSGNAFYTAVRAQPAKTWIQGSDFGTVKGFFDLSVAGGYVAQGRPSAIVDAWGGAALRQSDGSLYLTGGGHYDGNWNGMGSISLETGLASLPVSPSHVSDAQFQAMQASWAASPAGHLELVNGIYPNMNDPFTLNTVNPASGYTTVIGPTVTHGPKIKSVHTYGSFFVYNNKVLAQYGLWDLANNDGDSQDYGAGGTNIGGCATADGKMGYLVGSPNQYAATQVDMTTNPPSSITEWMDYPYVGGKGANVNFNYNTHPCVIGDKLFVIKTDSDGSPLFVPPLAWYMQLPLQNPGRTNNTVDAPALTNKWSAADMALLQVSTQAFDDVNNILYIPARDWSFCLTWKPLTGECGKVVMENAGPAQQANGAYGRFGYYRARQCFYLVNEFDQKPYFFHL